ncbi:TPA: helix-turn-helix transcriptional regulator [Clostridioides difficile]|uniref:helix-turn-helix domain-containing protein n=1 Tax=Clostridioides difficile TaxID=1496 RepID=UPI00038D0C53|nr:helix-turn-helix transcriptional regulator [Clostridioides difficile]EGT4936349.1 XRE family transcriptional regulator [Clostridioides difficile]EGT5050667.1 XRE family transcriptional regulator [Clostridioides difficile]EGT5525350.1 XRE family transcriptional regulator [Clostridioides difficile]EGT5560712.1 XRE family transcriptional regulator [Clostridioides difficile]EJA6787450.1 helix-turn-helix transcriptional regulator [Clostridioides difficile]
MYKDESNIFSKRLREEREELGLMQKEMANKLSLPANTYNGYETGKRSPALDVVRHIADTLDISTDYLLGRTNIKINISNITEKELIKKLNPSDDMKEILDIFSELDDDSKNKALKIAKLFLDEQNTKNKE